MKNGRFRGAGLLLLVLCLDVALTLPFVFTEAAEGDTLRYALGLDRWRSGRVELSRLFNVDMSFGYYYLVAGIRSLDGCGLDAVPRLLNRISWFSGLLATAGLFAWWRRWWGEGVAFRLILLFLLSPAYWSLHLYGNGNIVGLALAAVACAILPVGATSKPSGPASRAGLRFAAATLLLCLALSIRADVALLGPAYLGYLLWGRARPRWRTALSSALLAIVGYLLLREVLVGELERGGTVGHHWRANTNFESFRWMVRTATENLAALASSGPPLVFVASLIAFFGLRGREGRKLRGTALLWTLPGAIFLVFGRMHLTRILVPLLPGALLPLALWAARRGGRRDVFLGLTIVASHALMAFVPTLQNQLSDRDPATRRVGHYAFKDLMFRQHESIRRLAEETSADAQAVMARVDEGGASVVVIGGETLFYEFAFEVRHPDGAVVTTDQGYLVRLRKGEAAGRTPPVYFLEPRPGRDPEPDLLSFGLGPEVERHWIPSERRLRGLR